VPRPLRYVLPDGGESALPYDALGFQPRGSPGRGSSGYQRFAWLKWLSSQLVTFVPLQQRCLAVEARVAGWLVSPAPASAQAALDPPDPARPVLLARNELPTRPVLPRRRDLRVHHIERQHDRAHRVDITSPRCPAARRGQSTHRHDAWRTATTSVLAAVRSLSPERWEARTSAMANRRRL